MAAGIVTFADAVGAVGVGHHREYLVVFDQFVDKTLSSLVMDIVVARAVNEEQIALELVGVGNR